MEDIDALSHEAAAAPTSTAAAVTAADKLRAVAGSGAGGAAAGLGDEEDGEEEGEEGDRDLDAETLKAVRRERKKAKKAMKKAAKAAEGVGSEASSDKAVADQVKAAPKAEVKVEATPPVAVVATPPPPSGADGREELSAAAKKRRKKKKAAAAQEEADDTEEPVDHRQAEPGLVHAPVALPRSAVTPEPPRSPPPREAKGGGAGDEVDPPTPPTPSAPSLRTGSKAILVNLDDDFVPASGEGGEGSGACGGVSSLGAEWSPSLPEASLFNLCGPHLKVASAKGDCKGEDKSLLAASNVWTVPSIDGGDGGGWDGVGMGWCRGFGTAGTGMWRKMGTGMMGAC